MTMEKPNFGGVEEQEINVSESNESFESLQERIEVLQGVLDKFDSEIEPALKDFEYTARVRFSTEKGYDDSLKLKNHTNLVSKLAGFEVHLKSLVNLFETKDGGDGLNILWNSVITLREQLSVAPDIRYNKEAQIEKYGGEENIPAEKSLDTFEHTQDLIVSLKGEVKGIHGALRFMTPTKILK